MRIIGLTGGIACGKSLVSGALREAGCVIIDGDLLSRELVQPGSPVLEDIRQTFGERFVSAEGILDRKALGALVFADPEALARLNAVYRPHLRALIHRRLEEARSRGEAIAVLDMPLLYEEGLDALCDSVWCVTLPEETQLRRLMARDGLTETEALARVASQMPTREKAARAKVRIDNSGAPEETIRQALNALPRERAEENG